MARERWARASRRGGDSLGGGNKDAPPPRLATAAQIRKEQKLKAELYGDLEAFDRSKVTLPKLKFMEKKGWE